MAKSTTPAAAGDQTPPESPPSGFWRYTGVQRIYMHVPVTVDDGDVIAHDGPPADDGCWVPDPGPATRQPDNMPPPPEPAPPVEVAPTGAGEE